ncbi:PIR protein [Plasmodium vivax]|nr:PIR protein [Plasmodium vivax]
MEQDTSESTIELFKKEYNLKKNELFKFSIEFNKDCNNNDDECTGNNIPDSLNNKDFLRNLYVKYIRNIKNINNKNFSKFKIIDNGQNIEQRCIYLKYWIYDIMSKNVSQEKDISKFFDAFNSEKNLKFSDSNCPYKLYKMDLNKTKYMRKMYAYYMLFDIYKRINIKDSSDKKCIYCYYLNQFIDMYHKEKERCNIHNSENDCNEFNNYIKNKVDEFVVTQIKENCKNSNNISGLYPIKERKKNKDSMEINGKYAIFQFLQSFENTANEQSESVSIEILSSVCQNIECEHADCMKDFKSKCEHFIKMILRIPMYNNSDNNKLQDNYKKYLNYWIHDKLRVSKITEIDRRKFYTHFNESCSNFNELKTLNFQISDIKDDEYKKMNILYLLYYNYNKLQEEKTKELSDEDMKPLDYANICFNQFLEGVKMCKSEDDEKFHDALNEFRSFYKNVMYRKELYKIKEFKSLPELQSFSDLKKNNFQESTDSPCKNIKNNVLINTPRNQNEYDILLKGTTEGDIYKIFSEKAVDENICAEHCKNLISIYNSNEKIKALCATLATNLKNLSTITGVGNNYNDKCSNLKYWTYDQIFDIFSTGNNYKNNSLINEINQVIFRVNKELEEDKKCTFYVDAGYKDWVKERDLHYYFLNFDSLNTVKDVETENPKPCDYLKYINRLYKEHIKGCCTRYIKPDDYMENKCPSYFNCDKNYYPIDLMTKFKCENIDHKESVKDIFDSITVDLNVIRYSIFMNSFNQIINITNDPFYLFVLAVFGLLGFLFIFFIFYKFTPIGSGNRRRTSRRNMDMMETSNYPRQELTSYNKKNANANLKRKRAQIAYQVT